MFRLKIISRFSKKIDNNQSRYASLIENEYKIIIKIGI